ncbi:hypothetical protein M407DRAFT_18938 [Tulasnella calospora MUT 4182]|uniref:T6SS Phospholipase effector Tle1-like catalytic domain-containing protein n=1 Tax=Tulasnella calospora MUT 4182 TaxID=1051891 RepID=A0A0C3LDW2_9AGAM|nr:hypothetical protein M407DRAFT_18938 [Tulasnella calospora MUT 4182]
MASPSLDDGNSYSQKAKFDPLLPSPFDDSHRSPVGFIGRWQIRDYQGSRGSTILPVPLISSGFRSPNRTTAFPYPSQNTSMPSPSLPGGDYPLQLVGFSPNLPSPYSDAHRSTAGFRPLPCDHRYQPRNLILCFDGAAKYSNNGNTNVIRLFQGLDKMKTDKQLCYYQPGMGTTKTLERISQPVSKIIDMALAWYLDDHIVEAYRFLMENYREGDKICLFGFSRGAYTARCLAGMLHSVGLLPSGNDVQIRFAYALYKDGSEDGVQKAHGLKKAFSRHVSIEFMGLWDSVTSVGLADRTLPFTSHNAVVKTFRQAFALDERRAKFRHNPWSRAVSDGPPPPAMPNHLNRFKTRRQSVNVEEQVRFSEEAKLVGTAVRNTLLFRRKADQTQYRSDRHTEDQHAWQCPDCNFPWGETNCREVWFAGSHSDVGGGEVDTFEAEHRNNLSNPSLLWMVQQIDAARVGILWAPDAFDDVPTVKAHFDEKLESNFMSPKSPQGTESKLPQPVLYELHKDVEGKLHNSLGGITPWWLLEYIPSWKNFLDDNNQQWKELDINRGRGREIHHENPLFHRSVQLLEEKSDAAFSNTMDLRNKLPYSTVWEPYAGGSEFEYSAPSAATCYHHRRA